MLSKLKFCFGLLFPNMFDSFGRRDAMNLNSFVLLSQRIGIICNVLRHPLLESNILFSRKKITSLAVEDSILAIEKARVIRYAIASVRQMGGYWSYGMRII